MDHLKYKYKIKKIGGDPDKKITIALDESLWIHINNKKMRLIGAIETKSRKIGCDFMFERTMENLKTFVNNHIKPGTHITTDGFPAYSFLDDPDESVCTHEIHIHDGGDFGYGESSTSHIELTWAHLIETVKLLYIYKKNDNEKIKLF